MSLRRLGQAGWYASPMQYKDQLIRLTNSVHDGFVKAIRAMPEDQIGWSVMDTGRTPLDMFQEVAQAPTYSIPMLQTRSCADFDRERHGEMATARKEWDSLDKCEDAMRENLEKLFREIREFPDDELSLEIDLPFIPGLRHSMADIMAYPYWNTAYHLGQVSFIQTLYGDNEMR